MRLLLISNSGTPFLAHCRERIWKFVGNAQKVAFVTAAFVGDEERYFQLAKGALETAGSRLELAHLRWNGDGEKVLYDADALFVGGGNTYVLLQRIQKANLLENIRRRVLSESVSYIGSSGGSNIVGPSILTTNDWNIIGHTNFRALGFVPFNINAHYVEVDPTMAPNSETRDDRIAEYHTFNYNPVVGIEEETIVKVEDACIEVIGRGRVKVFRPNEAPTWHGPESVVPVELVGL